MLIVSNVLLASGAAVPLGNARIGYQTWLRGLPAGNVVASTTRADSAADAPLRPDTAEFWAPTALPATWEVDLGALRDFDYVGIAGHSLGSCGCTLNVASRAIASDAWTTFGTDVLLTEDGPLMALDALRTHRYLRLSISGGTLMPVIASIYAGIALAMERPIYGGVSPITLSRATVLARSLSNGGQFLGQGFRRHGVESSATFRHLSASWYRANFDPFVRSARRFPFFFAWRPATYSKEVAYAWCGNDIHPENMGVNSLMSVSFSMQGIGNE